MVNTNGCTDLYIYALGTYLTTLLEITNIITLYRDIVEPVHGRKVLDGLHASNK